MHTHPFEIHIHGDIHLRPEVSAIQIEALLEPLWKYANKGNFTKSKVSMYDDEVGISYSKHRKLLELCWTCTGTMAAMRQIMSDVCMELNEYTATGARIEVYFHDLEFDEDDDSSQDEDARDELVLFYVGPTPLDILEVQCQYMVEDVNAVMARHFESQELTGINQEIQKLFLARADALLHSLSIPGKVKPAQGTEKSRRNKPRRLH